MPPRCAREQQHIAALALRLTDAWHLAAREVNTLSGGEQARVHLAAAFAQLWEEQADGPRYLLLDEPTAALDLAHQHGLLRAARDFAARRGIGIVAVLHDLNLAAMYADRVLLLHQGRALGLGPPASVLREATVAAGFGVRARVLAHPLAAAPLVATAAAG
jgi:iron complex transport system ATP-binding protein